MLTKSFITTGLVALGSSSPAPVPGTTSCTFESVIPSNHLTWCPCETYFYCAKLLVPLDYQNLSLGQAAVPLLKLAALANSTDGPYQGQILINPGGPGASGIDEARTGATTIQSLVGSNFDIIGFDPRGVGLSSPSLNCSVADPANFTTTIRTRTVPRVSDDFYNSFITYGKELGAACQTTNGGPLDAGPHMTTATTARDMLSIADAFALSPDGARAAKDPSLLNYYGVSYGTFLGQSFASMFPSRVGNVVLDGLVSPPDYLANETSNAILHLDGVLAAFFVYCHAAGPEKCAYATGSSVKGIFTRFTTSFSRLDARKADELGWANATEIEDALLTLKVGMLAVGQQPLVVFPQLPQVLIGLEQALAANQLPAWTKQVQNITGDPRPPGVNQQWNTGVMCSDQDGALYGRNLSQLQPLIDELEQQSINGEVWIKNALTCVGWPIRSHDVFKGPFQGDTKTPILFVSNTYDPVTPIENSLADAPQYNGAQVLKVDAMGHTSANAMNLCAYGKVRAYFQASQLPGVDNACPLERGPFGVLLNGTLAENIENAGLADLHF